MNGALALVVSACVIALVYLAIVRAGASGGAESRLRKVCQGDQLQAERLIQAEQQRAPGISRSEAAGRAVQRYERDNR